MIRMTLDLKRFLWRLSELLRRIRVSKADKPLCCKTLVNGFSTEGQKVRPHWPDGTPAHTIKNFGVVNRYDFYRRSFRSLP